MLGNELIEVLPDEILDENNDPVYSGTVQEYLCSVDPIEGQELRDVGRQGATKGIRVHFPDGAGISTTARLRRDGEIYDVSSVTVFHDDDPDLAGPVAVATRGRG